MEQSSNVTGDRAYFAQRAAEELELAMTAKDHEAAEAHRRLQRVYTERAFIGSRITEVAEQVG